MPAFITDEDFQGDIVRALRHQRPDLDVVRVQDVGLMSQPDPVVLEWAAQNHRVLLTHDVNTMTREAYARTKTGLPMSGVFVVSRALSIGRAFEEIVLVAD